MRVVDSMTEWLRFCWVRVSQTFEVMLQTLEAFQKYPSILTYALNVLRDCVQRDRVRDWTLRNNIIFGEVRVFNCGAV